MYITYGGYPMYIREGGYPMYIMDGGGTRCTAGRGVPNVHFFSKPGLESEYPPLSGTSPLCTHSRVLGDPPG